jgi:predicted O-methyltransferase YrrM
MTSAGRGLARVVESVQPRRNWQFLRRMPRPWKRLFWHSVAIARRATKRGAAQKLRELAPLLAVLADRELETVLEIGTAAGGTFAAWCEIASSDALLVSIDLPGGPFSPNSATPELLQGHARQGQDPRFIRADSHLAETKQALVELLNGRAVDFLFIDGDHSYEGVRCDFELYAPLVRPGGLIALHDVVRHPPPSRCEVERFWNSVRRKHAHSEYVDAGGGAWGGIGVVYWRGAAAGSTAGQTDRGRRVRRPQRRIAS